MKYIFDVIALAASTAAAATLSPRALTPDNTCGGTKGYTCDPALAQGGPCCSSHGFCGSTSAYCGTGCQAQFSYGGVCTPPGTSPPAMKQGNNYVVSGLGTFTKTQNFTFTGTTLPAGLSKSTDLIDSTPYSHKFVASLATVAGGFLQLKVPGGQTQAPLKCAEVFTNVGQILYASVRTYAIFSSVPGTCHGSFFFRDDSQESDIEYLTDPQSKSNPGDGSSSVQYTNQALDGNPDDATSVPVAAPAGATTQVHEYRLDWVKGKTIFYIDGVLSKTLTTNVPNLPGNWVWNNWADGNQYWTNRLPASDNIFKIKNIVMYYNTTG